MNKEFEKQYRNYIAEQVPDMWDRIEAGLKEKNPVERYLEEERITGRKEKGYTGWFDFRRKKAAAVLVPAAAVFLCFLVSKILMENNRKSNNMTANYDMAFEENGFAQSPYPAEDSGYTDMAGGADMSYMPENAVGADAWEGEAAEAIEEVGNDVVTGEGTAETAGLFCARVKIVTVREASEHGYAAIYLAEIEKVVERAEESVSEAVSEGEEIYFYTGVDTDITEGETPKTGEEYEVLLEPVFGEENYFAKKIYFIP